MNLRGARVAGRRDADRLHWTEGLVLKLVAIAFAAGSFIAVQTLTNKQLAAGLSEVSAGLDSANVHLQRIDTSLQTGAELYLTNKRASEFMLLSDEVHSGLAHEDSVLDRRLGIMESLWTTEHRGPKPRR